MDISCVANYRWREVNTNFVILYVFGWTVCSKSFQMEIGHLISNYRYVNCISIVSIYNDNDPLFIKICR